MSIFFFFQAEDGIRDLYVTGVQTCALPISRTAIKPHAHAIQEHVTREAIQGKLGFTQLEFRFKGIEAEDELNIAKVYETEYRNNAVTPNNYRERRGWKPLEHQFADLLRADVEIATAAARGTAIVDDEDLTIHLERPPEPPAPKPAARTKRK